MNFLGPRLHFFALVIVVIIFGAGGVGKLMSMPQFHVSFADLGWPKNAGFAIGGLEVLGVIALFLPSLRKVSALGLGMIAGGAIWYHVNFPPVIDAAPAFICLISCILILMYRPAGVHR